MNSLTWARALCRLSRAFSALDAGQQIVRDELLFRFLPKSDRDAVTFDAYARGSDYVEGGENFSDGLFAWEEAILEDTRVPRSGRVLLGAAGGGRELRALLARGYEVFAFEPVASLFESAERMARGTDAVVVNAAYCDLVARAEGRAGPLDGLGGQIDLCILGWGSLSHLTEHQVVLETFRALRALAPHAPIMTSFIFRSEAGPALTGGARKMRRGLRRLLEAYGGRPIAAGLKFRTANGFVYEFSRSELTQLASQAGYEVARFVELPLAQALLVPTGAAGMG